MHVFSYFTQNDREIKITLKSVRNRSGGRILELIRDGRIASGGE